MPVAKYRNFNGYGFTNDGSHHQKDEAKKHADKIRRQGDRARIIKVKGGYEVYYRHGKKG